MRLGQVLNAGWTQQHRRRFRVRHRVRRAQRLAEQPGARPEPLALSSPVRARRASSQNGASVAPAARAPGTSPAAIAASSSTAQAGEVSARLAKA